MGGHKASGLLPVSTNEVFSLQGRGSKRGGGLLEIHHFVEQSSGDNSQKTGQKPVKKSLKKQFSGLDMYTLKDIRLQPAGAKDRSGHDALETFKLNVPVFLKEMGTITGSQWFARQLQDFQKMNADIIARLSLDEALSPKGG
jgi:hypothetical protein